MSKLALTLGGPDVTSAGTTEGKSRMDLQDWTEECRKELTEIWNREPKVLETQWGGELIGREALRDLLRTGLRPPHVMMVKDSEKLPSARIMRQRSMGDGDQVRLVDPDRMLNYLDRGYTVFLRRIDHWHVGIDNICHRLSDHFGRKVDAGLFATTAGAQGFVVHRDDGDLLVVQLNGAKQWRIYDGPGTDDWAPGEVKELGKPVLEPKLTCGETLYIPRGFGHAAAGSEGLSIHLTFQLSEIRTEDLARTLATSILKDLDLPARPLDHESLVAVASALRDQALERIGATSAEALITTARDDLQKAR